MIYTVSDRETISTLTSAVGFTAAKLAPTTGRIYYASIQSTGGDVRYTLDGTTPTSSKGKRLPQDSSVEIWGTTALGSFLAINDGGTAQLEVVYYGVGI